MLCIKYSFLWPPNAVAWLVSGTRWLSGNPLSSFDWSRSVFTGSRRWQGPYLEVVTTGFIKGKVRIGRKLNGEWHGIVYERWPDGYKLITQFVNGKWHGAQAGIQADGTLLLGTYENGACQSDAEGWCRNRISPNVYIRVHAVPHAFLIQCTKHC